MAIETVPQEGRRADALRRNLEQIRLPEGFRIELFAVVPDARHIAVGPSSGVIFVGTRKQRVWAVTDRDRDRLIVALVEDAGWNIQPHDRRDGTGLWWVVTPPTWTDEDQRRADEAQHRAIVSAGPLGS